MDDDRLKNLGGGNYWKELLDRIRDIRSSEKVMYRQVLDLTQHTGILRQKSFMKEQMLTSRLWD